MTVLATINESLTVMCTYACHHSSLELGSEDKKKKDITLLTSC